MYGSFFYGTNDTDRIHLTAGVVVQCSRTFLRNTEKTCVRFSLKLTHKLIRKIHFFLLEYTAHTKNKIRET